MYLTFIAVGIFLKSHVASLFKFSVSYFYFFVNLFILFIDFWLCWVFVAACGISLVGARGGYSSLRCAGFSLRWLLVAEHEL